jgi:hypothetical protein
MGAEKMNSSFAKMAFLFLGVVLSLTACSPTVEKKENDKDTSKQPVIDSEKPLPPEVKKKSKTKDEVLALVKDYIKKNKRKLSIEGEIQDYVCVGGDYSGDGLTDFFVTVTYYPGGDFVYPEYFFYSSDADEVNALKVANTLDKSVHENIHWIHAKRLEKGKIVGKAFLMMAWNMEEDFNADVPCSFAIENNKIVINKLHRQAFNRANKQIVTQFQERQAELESIQEMEQEETSTE